jgi:hypothetical protein
MPLEVLDFAFVFFRCGKGLEGPQIPAISGLWILDSRIQPVFAGLEPSNHCDSSSRARDA